MFDRLESLIGKEKLDIIKSKKVLVIGVGGVGGYVIEALVRSGIENITIIDKDVVDVTNLNRQIIALTSTIGKYKVDVMKERILDINPNVSVTPLKEYLIEERVKELGLEKYDYIVDCIDDVRVKVALAKRALTHNINLIISTGTARKLHPELLEMTTLDKTEYDPLARKLRESLRGMKTDRLIVLASKEKPIECPTKSLGSTAFVPSSGGLLIASYIINDIIEH